MGSKGVALIVVHGVADQKPGDTARAVVDLLVGTDPGLLAGATYAARSCDDIALAVEPLPPRRAPPRRADATPRSEDRSLVKAWLQSLRSDFQRQGWEAPKSMKAFRSATGGPPMDAGADRGIAATDYLLAKHRDNGAGREVYETSCIGVERTADGATAGIAVYEMYWADLSRLSGALPRIVTEMFTMVFRLSKLGRDTVDEARSALFPRRPVEPLRRPFELAWNVTDTLQIALDWMFANVLALLFAQLFLLALVFVALGVATLFDSRLLLHVLLAGGVAVVALLVFAYRRRDTRVRDVGTWAPPLVLAAACAGAIAWPPLRPWLSALLLVAAVTALYEIGLRIADDRFPFVRIVGRCLWGALLLLMLASAVYEIAGVGDRLDPEIFDVGWHAAIFGVELTLWLVKWWWIAAGVMLAVWFVAGLIAARLHGYEARASLATGRLGLALSLVTFLTLTMAIWALLTTAIDISARSVAYSPCIFAFDEDEVQKRESARIAAATDGARPAAVPKPAYAPIQSSCLWRTGASVQAGISTHAPTPASAGLFLADRYRSSTASFSLLAAVLLALVAYLGAMFTPSILAELKLLVGRARERAKKRAERHGARPAPALEAERLQARDQERIRVRRLGRWLTAGFRRIDFVVAAVAGFGVVIGVVVAVAFIGETALGSWAAQAAQAQAGVVALSQSLLKPLVLTTAGIAAALTLLGGVLSKYLPALRAPLDIALDVDNHFREFPRAAIPRARIFSRYAALLRHVAAQGHERIVVVAHSQGTVISAELLRFLASDGVTPPQPGELPKLAGAVLPELRLLTLGCPLRQLYAARFPTLYRWVIARQGRVTGPRAHDVGVARWINGFCSGDYVGRWLWSDSPDDGDPVGQPMLDTTDRAPFGRAFAYDGFDPVPPLALPFASAKEVEVCLGFGAHTHYFESDRADVAWLIDALVA